MPAVKVGTFTTAAHQEQATRTHPIYILNDSGGHKPKHVYHFPDGSTREIPHHDLKLPYCLPPIGQSASTTSSFKRPMRFQVKLDHGYITDRRVSELLPNSVLEELIQEYGNISHAEVVITCRDGTYTIHSKLNNDKSDSHSV